MDRVTDNDPRYRYRVVWWVVLGTGHKTWDIDNKKIRDQFSWSEPCPTDLPLGSTQCMIVVLYLVHERGHFEL